MIFKEYHKSMKILLVVCVLAIILIIGLKLLNSNSGLNTENIVFDENYTTKAYCIFDAYEYQKQNGSTKIILEGSTNNTKVSVVEKIESRNLTWNDIYEICENRKAEIEQFVDSSFKYDTDTKKDTAGNTIYMYELTYEYKTRDDITSIIDRLKKEDYKCIIIKDDKSKEIAQDIIGKWVSKEDENKYFIFNEDGTGIYSYAKYDNCKEDFMYSYNGDDTITYIYRAYYLELGYDKEKNVLYGGGRKSADTGKIILDEKVNTPYYKQK